MYDIYDLLGISKNSSLKIYEQTDNLIDIFTSMVTNEYSQIVYNKNNRFYLMTELSIEPFVNEFAKKASEGLNPKPPVLSDAIRFNDVILEVIDFRNSPEECLVLIRKAIKLNMDKYASILVKIHGQYHYFNYSDLEILNKITF